MIKSIVLGVLFFIINIFNAYAWDDKGNESGYLNNNLFLTAQYSVHTQYMDEYLYTNVNNTKSSELNWQNKFTSVLTFGIEWKPIKSLTLGFIGSFNVFKNTGIYQMDDYDWVYVMPTEHHTHHSNHTEGKFKYMNFDLFGKYNFYSLNLNSNSNLNFYALLGFRYTEITSGAMGGTYWYYNGEEIGTFENDGVGLEYRQRMFMPYFGLALEYQYQRFSTILTFKNSILNLIKARDWHRERPDGQQYTDMKFDFVYQYSFDLNIGYWLNDRLRVFSFVSMLHTIHNKDNQSYYSNLRDFGKTYVGMSNISYSFGIGFTIGLDTHSKGH